MVDRATGWYLRGNSFDGRGTVLAFEASRSQTPVRRLECPASPIAQRAGRLRQERSRRQRHAGRGSRNATSNAIAMYALNYSTYTGGGPGAGGFAIYGLSAKGHGLVGATAAAGAAAVVGATNGVAGAYAAAFYGPVIVGGDFTVVGGAKSAAVPHPDGSHRRLYCMESPESWFEDFGEAALVCGEASIALDPDFAAVVDASEYHVFLTGYDGRPTCPCAIDRLTGSACERAQASGGHVLLACRGEAQGHCGRSRSSVSRSRRNRRCQTCRPRSTSPRRRHRTFRGWECHRGGRIGSRSLPGLSLTESRSASAFFAFPGDSLLTAVLANGRHTEVRHA